MLLYNNTSLVLFNFIFIFQSQIPEEKLCFSDSYQNNKWMPLWCKKHGCMRQRLRIDLLFNNFETKKNTTQRINSCFEEHRLKKFDKHGLILPLLEWVACERSFFTLARRSAPVLLKRQNEKKWSSLKLKSIRLLEEKCWTTSKLYY